MKLLFVHDQFGARGGAESNIFDTATELKRRGHVVGILHGENTGKSEAAWRELFGQRFTLSEDIFAIAAAVQSFQPDAIYVHKTASLLILETLVASGIPLARMVHDHDIYCMRGYKYNPLTRVNCTRAASAYCMFPCGASLARNRSGFPVKWVSYAEKKREIQINQRFQRMVVYSRYMKEELVRNGFESDKVEILSPMQTASGQDLHSSFSDRNVIIFAGQIIRGKGVDVLLESLAQVQIPFECRIFGEGNHRHYCEQLAQKLGLADRVQFRGFVGAEELAQHYLEATLAVVSSVWPEPFGLVGPEAMRYGLPVVAFDVGGVSEWLIDGVNGHLVPRMDRAAFADRVQQLLNDKSRAREMGEQGRELAREKHDPSTQTIALEKMFKRMTAATGDLVKV